MKTRLAVVVAMWVAIATLVAGCKKEGATGGSAGLDPAEKALLQYLPGGAPIVFGGNYMKLQNLLQGGLGTMTEALDKMAPGMSAWTKCFTEMAEHKLRAAGVVTFVGNEAQLRMAFSGVTLDEAAACAQKANFKFTIDPDKKFMSIEMPMASLPGATASYLVLPSGALYTRFNFSVGMTVPMSLTRSVLEADASGFKTTAADDAALAALAAKVDHSKTVWFVGRADGTPLADKVGDVYGTFDLSNGLAVDVVAQIKVADDAKKIEDGVAQARKVADQLPGDVKDVVKNMTLERNGDRLHFGVAVSSTQLKNIMSQFGGMLGSGLGGSH
jgi:hypothetical protein